MGGVQDGWERAHVSSTLEAARSHESRTWQEHQGSVTKLWITLDRSDRTLASLTRDTKNKTETWQHKNMSTQDWHTTDKKNQNTETKRGGREAKPVAAGKLNKSREGRAWAAPAGRGASAAQGWPAGRHAWAAQGWEMLNWTWYVYYISVPLTTEMMTMLIVMSTKLDFFWVYISGWLF